jgi:ABC-2 type transport system ATP-binding protein
MSVLVVKNLHKSFGDQEVVKDISFSLEEGEILGILGPNGAGKTTTIQMLLGILTPTSGQISYFGKDLKDNQSEILERVNFSSTYTDLPWRLTVKENLTWVSYLYHIENRQKRLDKIKSMFRLVELWNKPISDLSAGQQTRVNLAKAYLNFPSVLLLDEPTASLDPEVALYIREFLEAQRQNYKTSVILTSHNMTEVEELCDRVIVIKDGTIVAEDTPHGLAKRIEICHLRLRLVSGTKKLLALTQAQGLKLEHRKDEAVIAMKETLLPNFLSAVVSQGIVYSEITIDKPSLQDYFMTIAQGGTNVEA